MSVEIDPQELSFQRPFNQEVCQVLHLHNYNEEPLVFKVKTTAPKHYCVRPNSGRIEPGKGADVQVLLQAMKEEPAPDAKCKDKFLVQSVAVTKDMEFANVTSIFEKSSKSSVVERKIRVTWLAPITEPKEQSHLDDEPPAYPSPNATYETPAPRKTTAEQGSPIPPPDFSEKLKSESSPPPNEPSSFTSAKAAVINALPSSDDLKAQLSDANAQIQRLKDRLADQGLRQRKTGGEAKAAPATMQQTHTQGETGVPLQIVAGLCLLSFLIAYFFF
ncbi:PapD-like protein [Penicillium malachiteum]|uniref:PapD-like protein n=1 Tax=Penicillium malachiteum TaxID=1324776 RepID=UPI0025465F69|nr:PapD-like protein [Penicillium malachiteum]KAJ5725791.1 PapD-like protein [Penicillium malachiteum]